MTTRYATSTAHSLLYKHKADEYGTMPGQRLKYNKLYSERVYHLSLEQWLAMGNHDVDPALKQQMCYSHVMTLYYTYIYCDLKNNVQYGKQYNSSKSCRILRPREYTIQSSPLVTPANQTVPKR